MVIATHLQASSASFPRRRESMPLPVFGHGIDVALGRAGQRAALTARNRVIPAQAGIHALAVSRP